MKELKEIILNLVKGISPKQAFILLLVSVMLAGSYFIFDRYLDHLEFNDYVEVIQKSQSRMDDFDSRINFLQNLIQNRLLTKSTEN